VRGRERERDCVGEEDREERGRIETEVEMGKEESREAWVDGVEYGVLR
jgi:hypothetical protein